MKPHILQIAAGLLLSAAGLSAVGENAAYPTCSATAGVLRQACGAEGRDDYLTEAANCLNEDDVSGCLAEAGAEYREGRAECREVFSARLEVCDGVGEAPYQPAFGAAFANTFVDPLLIGDSVTPNPYFPLVPGNFWVYEDPDGEETITVEVTGDTKNIDGVTCIVVVDTAEEDGVAVEITRDWYAQDAWGNVYYCGEISENFEVFDGDAPEEPELVDIEGSWKHARDGAKAGILLPFDPMPGQFFRQEVAWGDAEDVIEILDLSADETATLEDDSVLSCNGTCLRTRDFTPLEPDAEENKFYLPGVGLLVETDPEEGSRVELKAYGNNPL
ncbi:MAG: hypothetical protein RIB46_10855 [Pseudomonadales bacterium]